MKVLSVSAARPQDLDDLEMLFAAASDPEIEAARQAVEQIAARGHGRGKDLAAEFEGLRNAASRPGSG